MHPRSVRGLRVPLLEAQRRLQLADRVLALLDVADEEGRRSDDVHTGAGAVARTGEREREREGKMIRIMNECVGSIGLSDDQSV